MFKYICCNLLLSYHSLLSDPQTLVIASELISGNPAAKAYEQTNKQTNTSIIKATRRRVKSKQ